MNQDIELQTDASIVEALFVDILPPTVLQDLGLDDEDLSDALTACGVRIEHRFPPSIPGVMQMMVMRRYVCVTRLRWQLLVLIISITLDAVVTKLVAPSVILQTLSTLPERIIELTPNQEVVLLRLLDQQRALGEATVESLGVGLSKSDKEDLGRIIDELCDRSVIVQSDSGALRVDF